MFCAVYDGHLQALEQLEQFVKECDRRTDQAKKKLAETQEELSAEATVKLNKINELAEEIGTFTVLVYSLNQRRWSALKS